MSASAAAAVSDDPDYGVPISAQTDKTIQWSWRIERLEGVPKTGDALSLPFEDTVWSIYHPLIKQIRNRARYDGKILPFDGTESVPIPRLHIAQYFARNVTSNGLRFNLRLHDTAGDYGSVIWKADLGLLYKHFRTEAEYQRPRTPEEADFAKQFNQSGARDAFKTRVLQFHMDVSQAIDRAAGAAAAVTPAPPSSLPAAAQRALEVSRAERDLAQRRATAQLAFAQRTARVERDMAQRRAAASSSSSSVPSDAAQRALEVSRAESNLAQRRASSASAAAATSFSACSPLSEAAQRALLASIAKRNLPQNAAYDYVAEEAWPASAPTRAATHAALYMSPSELSLIKCGTAVSAPSYNPMDWDEHVFENPERMRISRTPQGPLPVSPSRARILQDNPQIVTTLLNRAADATEDGRFQADKDGAQDTRQFLDVCVNRLSKNAPLALTGADYNRLQDIKSVALEAQAEGFTSLLYPSASEIQERNTLLRDVQRIHERGTLERRIADLTPEQKAEVASSLASRKLSVAVASHRQTKALAKQATQTAEAFQRGSDVPIELVMNDILTVARASGAEESYTRQSDTAANAARVLDKEAQAAGYLPAGSSSSLALTERRVVPWSSAAASAPAAAAPARDSYAAKRTNQMKGRGFW